MAALANDESATSTASPTTPLTIPPWAGRRGGYTPFEYVAFPPDGEAEELTHEVVTVVKKPRSEVYGIWADRMNLGEWTSLLGQTVLHTADASSASYFFFYRWGTLPVIELYTTCVREVIENEAVTERSVDGWPLCAAAFFADGPDAGTTTVTFRAAYALPTNLAESVGAAGIYAHVDEILRADAVEMARFCETVDMKTLAAARVAEAAALEARASRIAGMSEADIFALAEAAEPEGLYDEVMAEMEEFSAEWEREDGDGDEGGGEVAAPAVAAAEAEAAPPKQQRRGRKASE